MLSVLEIKYGLLTLCEVKTAGYCSSSFLRVLARDVVKANKLAKKERGQYQAIFTNKA